MNLLELFAGTRSIGKVADDMNMNVFSIDYDPGFKGIDKCMDIGELKLSDVPFTPDIIWASPDCKTYSIAGISTHRDGQTPKSDYAKACDRVNQHFIGLIKQWLEVNPNMIFWIENPRGMLRKMPFMQEFKEHLVWYCRYGHESAKPTNIWTNSKTWMPRPICKNYKYLKDKNNQTVKDENGQDVIIDRHCHHAPARRGAKTGTQGRVGAQRSVIPTQLCEAVLNASVRQIEAVRQLYFNDYLPYLCDVTESTGSL